MDQLNVSGAGGQVEGSVPRGLLCPVHIDLNTQIAQSIGESVKQAVNQ
jgi:hypothetical protein